MNIRKVFPTPIGYFNNKTFTDKVLTIVNGFINELQPSQWGYKSSYNDAKISRRIVSNQFIMDYVDVVATKFVNEIGFQLPKPYKVDFFVSKILKDEWHDSHVHPNSMLSGVFYLKADKNVAPLYLKDPRSARLFNGFTHKDVTKKDTSRNIESFQPKSGDRIIFESWVPHVIPPSKIESERITLVYNIFK